MKATCFQVEIDGRWKYLDPENFGMAFMAHGRVRLATVDVPKRPRFSHFRSQHAPGARPARVRAAEKALERQREKAGLFSEYIRAQQPTPEERIAAFDASTVRFHQELRAFEREKRRSAWNRLKTLPEHARATVLLRYNDSFHQGNASGLNYIIDQVLAESGGVQP